MAHVPTPQVAAGSDGNVSSESAQHVQSALNQLPTSAPGLNMTAGAAPRVNLDGAADPARLHHQQAEVEQHSAEALEHGQQDVAEPVGENEIHPEVPRETLRAEVPAGGDGAAAGAEGGAAATTTSAGGGGGGGASGAGGDDSEEGASIVAQQEKGGEIRAAVAQAQGQMAARQQEHATQTARDEAAHQRELSQITQEHTAQIGQEQARARTEVGQHRGEWTQAQHELAGRARNEAGQEVTQATREVAEHRTQAEQQAEEHISQGNQEAAEARRQGEQEAAQARAQGRQESGGIFGWVASRVQALFDRIKSAVQQALDRALSIVRSAIERARNLAQSVIQRARDAIGGVISRVVNAIVSIGDRLFPGFRQLYDRFRSAMRAVVNRIRSVVNRIANALKDGIRRALNFYVSVLTAGFNLLRRGLQWAVNTVRQAVQGALQWARSAIAALGAFASLIKDIAASPGQWIRNLGSAIMDGIRNHLWRAFKNAVQNWFNQKLEEVLGVGLTIWRVLTQGGISLAQVGRMAWEAIKQAIPMALIQILVEKLVSMIVPAAGAIMAIIEGLKAAWGTVSRIIQAINRFVNFLKAVRSGQGGPPFADALAAAAITVIDFVANWLIARLRRPAGAVAGRIRQMAQRIMARIRQVAQRVMGAVRRGASAVGSALRRGAQAVGRGIRAVGRGVRRVATGIANSRVGQAIRRSRFGQAVGRGMAAIRQRIQNVRQRIQQWRERRRQQQQQNPQERLDRAVSEIKPRLDSLLERGVSSIRLRATLAFWRIRYRLSRLAVEGEGTSRRVVAQVNPSKIVDEMFEPHDELLLTIINRVGQTILEREDVRQAAEDIARQRTPEGGGRGRRGENPPVEIGGGVENLGAIRDFRETEIEPRQVENLRVGGMSVSERERESLRGSRSTVGTTEVEQVGTYRSINSAINSIKAETGLSDQEIALVLRGIAQSAPRSGGTSGSATTGAVAILENIRQRPNGEQMLETIGGLHRLLHHVEGGRAHVAVVATPMLVEMVIRGEMRFDEAFDNPAVGGRAGKGDGGRGGLFPPSQVGAVGAMNRVASEVGASPVEENPTRPQNVGIDVPEQRRRQLEFAKRWIKMKLDAEKREFPDRQKAEEFLEQYITTELEKALREGILSHYNIPDQSG